MQRLAQSVAEKDGEYRRMQDAMQTMEKQRAADFLVRRQLHEEVQSLKGAVRVYCRVRKPQADSAADCSKT
jgi:hypothetical protein